MALKIFLPLLGVLLAGCVTLPAGPGVTMAPAPGKPFDQFRSEFDQCTRLAESRLYHAFEYGSSLEAQGHYDSVYLQCMLSYGNVVQSPAFRIYRISPP